MMGLIREWLLSMTGAAILSAAARSLMPEGSVKRVGDLICGMVLMLLVLRPLGEADLENLRIDWEYDSTEAAAALQKETEDRMKIIIEREFSAYSMDKAVEFGLQCQVKIHCREEDGIFLPDTAEIAGEVEERFLDFLYTDLGIPRDGLVILEEVP